MKPATRWVPRGVAAGLALAALAASAQSRKIGEYKLHEQEDRGAPFAMTLGPDHTVYTLLPRRDGNWVLSEVQNWWQPKPHEIGILIEGFSARDPVSAIRQTDLFVTSDNQYLVTILTAALRVAPDDPNPTDMIVEVVRLRDFEVLTTSHMRGLGLRGDLAGGFDRSGQLLVSSSIAGGDSAPAPWVTWFAVSLPAVKAQLQCSYQAAADPKDAQPMEAACADWAKKEGYASAADLGRAVWAPTFPPAPPAPPGVSISSKDRFQIATVTVDSKPLTLVVINGVDLQVYSGP
jgi:hypothetical protein